MSFSRYRHAMVGMVAILVSALAILLTRGHIVTNVAMLLLTRQVIQGQPHASQTEAWLLRSIGLRPDESRLHRHLALSYEETGRQAEAGAQWRAGEVTVQEFLWLAQGIPRDYHRSKEILWYQRGLHTYPQSSDLWYNLGLALQIRGQRVNAREPYERAIEFDQWLDRRAGPSSALVRLGEYARFSLPADLPEALRLYCQALELDAFYTDEDAANAHYRLGEVQLLLGESSAYYVPEFEKALRLDPRYAWAWAQLGYFYYYERGDIALAIEYLSRAIQLEPKHKTFYFWLAQIYHQSDLPDRAEIICRLAADRWPDDPEVRACLEDISRP